MVLGIDFDPGVRSGGTGIGLETVLLQVSYPVPGIDDDTLSLFAS